MRWSQERAPRAEGPGQAAKPPANTPGPRSLAMFALRDDAAAPSRCSSRSDRVKPDAFLTWKPSAPRRAAAGQVPSGAGLPRRFWTPNAGCDRCPRAGPQLSAASVTQRFYVCLWLQKLKQLCLSSQNSSHQECGF